MVQLKRKSYYCIRN